MRKVRLDPGNRPHRELTHPRIRTVVVVTDTPSTMSMAAPAGPARSSILGGANFDATLLIQFAWRIGPDSLPMQARGERYWTRDPA